MCLHHKQMQMVKWLIIIQEAYSKHWIFDASYFAARSTLFSIMPELKTESFKKKKKNQVTQTSRNYFPWSGMYPQATEQCRETWVSFQWAILHPICDSATQ